jgi:protein-S-isoprenylcysteine O-methyltransferase Ste14
VRPRRPVAINPPGTCYRWEVLGVRNHSLRKQFSVQVTIQENHQLVTGGLYRYLRHPRYLGILVFNLGIALVFRSRLGLALVAALGGVLLVRVLSRGAAVSKPTYLPCPLS